MKEDCLSMYINIVTILPLLIFFKINDFILLIIKETYAHC